MVDVSHRHCSHSRICLGVLGETEMKTMIEMAREVFDVTVDSRGRETFSGDSFGIERFAELVRADERENGQKWFDAVTAQHKQAILAEREALIGLLKGIDKTEIESADGWWETSSGADFGAGILAAIRARSNT